MIKIILIILVCLFAASCSQIGVNNLVQKEDNSVDIPISSSINTGWIITNENEIVNYNYQKNDLTNSVNFRPRREYGDLFFVDEYVGINEVYFYSGIVANRLHTKLDILDKFDYIKRRIDWDNYTLAQLIILLNKSIEEIINENTLDNTTKTKITKIYQNGANIDLNLIKEKVNYSFNNTYTYPPSPMINTKRRDISAYMPRKNFSSMTAQIGTAFISKAGAISTSSFISVYPTVTFPVYEDLTETLDRFSIDIGILNESNTDATHNYDEADNRYMVGFGYSIGKNISFQIGKAVWDDTEGTSSATYYGFSLDILNLVSSVSN